MDESDGDPRKATTTRLGVGLAVALVFCLGCYLLLEATRPSGGLVGFAFLLILPAAVSAFIAYVADPLGERRYRFYLRIPLYLMIAVIGASFVVLREGVICVVILSPLWLGSSVAGVSLTYHLRRRRPGEVYGIGFLALPLLAMQVEPMLPLPVSDVAVVRSAVIDASPDAIWPLLRGIPDVHPGEGRWNVTQDLLGVPRPLGARLVGDGVGAVRWANWGERIRFRETIDEWRPGRRIGWRFRFDDLRGWGMTDRHLLPDSPYFRVTTGGYTLVPLPDGRTRVTLDTHYRLRTPVNAYSRLWGELFLGDLEGNLLALIQGRAERPQRTSVTKL